ncbi:MAG: hypothetical protein R3F61_11195 [Myxococcota bacterium]
MILAALFVLPGLAQAADGLAWKWAPEQSRRYVLNSQTQVSEVFWIRAQDNLDRRILEWQLNIITTCTGVEPLGKSAYTVSCSIDDLAIAARPTNGDEDRVIDILNEYDEKITGARIVLKFGTDGRFETIDLEDVKHNRSNDRTRQIQEIMRLLLIRAYAGLEVILPKGGADKGKPWKVSDPEIMGFPSLKGTAGGLAVTASVTREQGSKVVIETGGEGTRGPAIYDQRDQIRNMWDMRMFSKVTFDMEKGELVKSEMLAEGTITPSSKLASAGTVPPYVQAVNVQDLALDAEYAPLPPNAVIGVPPADAPDEAAPSDKDAEEPAPE